MRKQRIDFWSTAPLSAEGEERIEASALALRLLAGIGVFAVLSSTRPFSRPIDVVALVLYVSILMLRILPPFRVIPPQRAGASFLVLEVLACSAAVLITGGWVSSYVISLLSPLFLIGVVYGLLQGLAVVVVIAVPFTLISVFDESRDISAVSIVQVAFLLITSISIGVLTRSLLRASRRMGLESAIEMDRLRRAGVLVRELHTLVLKTPGSFDLNESVSNLVDAVRISLPMDAIAIYTFNETEQLLTLVGSEGCRPDPELKFSELPTPFRAVAQSGKAIALRTDTLGPLLGSTDEFGIYAGIRSRDALLGFVAVEHRSHAFTSADAEVLDELLLPISFALDNAQWFERVSDAISETERVRIARDLHDHVAQGLAHLQLEISAARRGSASESTLPHLEAVVRNLLVDVRGTLRDLRQGSDDEVDLRLLIQNEVQRVHENGIEANVQWDVSRSELNGLQRREAWMIVREAIRNAEQHSNADRILVSASELEHQLIIEIVDNGAGFDVTDISEERFGIVGMRERANAVGATLTFTSGTDSGTLVRLEVPV